MPEITYLRADSVPVGALLHTDDGLVTVTYTYSDGASTGLAVIDARGLYLSLVFDAADVLPVEQAASA